MIIVYIVLTHQHESDAALLPFLHVQDPRARAVIKGPRQAQTVSNGGAFRGPTFIHDQETKALEIQKRGGTKWYSLAFI